MKSQAHISKKKTVEVNLIKENLDKHKVILIADLTGVPSAQLQSLKSKIKDRALIRVTKKRLIKLAISGAKNKSLTMLLPYLDNCIPALIFTDEDSFKLYKFIIKNKSSAFAKPGQVSPIDIIIQAGPTNFPPGPIIGELGQAGIIAAVESGKVTIKKETKLVKKGDVINNKVADVLVKLGIEPIEIGLNIVASFQDGVLYSKDILSIDEETYINNIKLSYLEAFGLAISLGYVTKDNIKLLIKKCAAEAKIFSKKQNIFTSDTAIEELQRAEIELKVMEEKAPGLKDIKTTKVYHAEREIKKQTNEKVKETQVENTVLHTVPHLREDETEQEEVERKQKKEVNRDQIGYTEDNVKAAQDILSRLQDEKAKKMKIRGDKKGFWD